MHAWAEDARQSHALNSNRAAKDPINLIATSRNGDDITDEFVFIGSEFPGYVSDMLFVIQHPRRAHTAHRIELGAGLIGEKATPFSSTPSSTPPSHGSESVLAQMDASCTQTVFLHSEHGNSSPATHASMQNHVQVRYY